MKDYNFKTDFISLLMDEEFVSLVQHSENPDYLLERLIEANISNEKSVRYAFEFIRINQSKKNKLQIDDFNRILNVIQTNINENQKTNGSRRFPLWLQIAAVFIILVSIGGFVIYHQLTTDTLTEFATSKTERNHQGVLILSDGSKQQLRDNESFIDYNSNKGEVVIKKDEKEKIIATKNSEKNSRLNQVIVPFGQRHKILLSDGTLVQLNAGSKFTFPAMFSGKTREVYLSGEGFFEVHKNAELPFVVKTDYMDIKVLGTSFNVSAYDDEQIVATVLVEGKINVSQKNKLFKHEQVHLVPGQGYFYSVNEQHSKVREVNVNDYVSWKDGIFIFKNSSLQDVITRICKYYNQKVKIETEELAKTKFSGKFVLTENPEEVLLNLSKTLEGRLEKTDDENYIIKKN